MINFKYLFDKFNVKPKGVLHCGASTGQEAETYKSFGIEKVIWIEAIPDVFENLEKHLRFVNCETGATCINACISDVDGKEVIFNVSNNEAQSSSYLDLGHHLIIHPTVQYIDKIPMKTIRLDTLLQSTDMTDYDFANFDLQGAELDAMKGLGDLIKNFKYIYSEVNKKSTYIGCPLIEDLDIYLSTWGFDRVETGQWVGDCWTDAFWIKK